MKSPAQLDREIHAVADFVNGFRALDPHAHVPAIGLAVHEALMWARGRHVPKPSERLKKLREGRG